MDYVEDGADANVCEREETYEKSLYEWFYFPLYQTVINLEQLAFKWQKDHIFVAYLWGEGDYLLSGGGIGGTEKGYYYNIMCLSCNNKIDTRGSA